MSDITLSKDNYDKLIEALNKATHPGFETCNADVCKEIVAALRAAGALKPNAE